MAIPPPFLDTVSRETGTPSGWKGDLVHTNYSTLGSRACWNELKPRMVFDSWHGRCVA